MKNTGVFKNKLVVCLGFLIKLYKIIFAKTISSTLFYFHSESVKDSTLLRSYHERKKSTVTKLLLELFLSSTSHPKVLL